VTTLGLDTLDPQLKNTEEATLEENRRSERRPTRGLEDVSHLFLSQSPDKPAENLLTARQVEMLAEWLRTQNP